MSYGLEIIFWVLRFLIGAVIFRFSYLLLHSKCAGCVEQISNRTFIVACMGGAGFVSCGAVYGVGPAGLISLRGLLGFLFLLVLMMIAVMDYDTQRIDNCFHVILFVLGAAAVRLFPEYSLGSRCAGIFVISVPMLILALIIPGAFGGGDIKLMAVCGWFLGMRLIVCAMCVALLTAGIYCTVLLVRKKIGRREQFAFGPWLAVGLSVAVLYGGLL